MSCLQLKEDDDDIEMKTRQETMKHRWLVANQLCKQIPCLSKNMAYNLKLDCSKSENKDTSFQLPSFWSCNNCHQVFTSDSVKIRSTSKKNYKNRIGKNLRSKLNRNFLEKHLKEKSIFSAICNSCKFISKTESFSRKKIKEINETRVAEIKKISQKSLSKQDISKSNNQQQKNKKTHVQTKKHSKLEFKSKGKLSWKDRVASSSTKNTQLKRKKNKLADMLKTHSNKTSQPSKTSGIISFLP